MTEIFLHIVNMSITASIFAVVVLILRLLLKKAPKWISVLLWGLVALRLICPFAVESSFSLIPKTDWIVEESVTPEDLFLSSVPDNIPAIDPSTLGEDVVVHYYPIENPEIQIHRGISVAFILSCVWVIGMAALLLYTAVSTARLQKSIIAAVRVRDNVWESSAVDSPFVLGLIRPRIYVPRGMTEDNLAYVIAHEEAHIHRRDHLWKPLGFLLLTIHWFNPVLWLAYILLCRDIEMACDERVVNDMDEEQRADYSEALLECSVNRKMISACPLAFGEVGVKERIKSVLHYRKPGFWIVITSIIVCAIVAVCFLTNPTGDMFSGDKTLFIYYEDPAEVLHYPYQLKNDTVVNVKFKTTQSPKTVTLEIFCRKSSVFDEWQKSNIATLKLGETVSFTVPEGHMFKIEASRNSGTNGNVTFDISYGKLNTLGQGENEVQNDNLPTEGTGITLDDVIELSAKGENLTWTDFAGYSYTDIGSGLFIWHLPIDEVFSVKVGGGSVMTLPAFVFLCAGSGEDEERIDIRYGGVQEFIHLHQKNNISPTDITDEDKENFSYTLLTDILEFYDPKAQIYSKMLNAIDYYNSAHIEFYPYMLSSNMKVVCELDLNSGKAYQASYTGNELIQEYFSDGKTVSLLNHKHKYYEAEYSEAFTREDSEPIPLSKRITIESDGLPSYNYRRNITNCPLSSYTLYPQELAFSYLANFSRWTIVEESTFLGRECVVIEGNNSPYMSDKHNASTFRLTVDKETGIVLMLTGEKNGKETKMIEVTALELGITSVYQVTLTDIDFGEYSIK